MSGFPQLLFLLTAREGTACAEPFPDSELDSTAVAPTPSSPVRAPVSAAVKTGTVNSVKTGEIAAVLSRC
jgi:hypothetical protein